MKELSIEEKAKAYDEVREKIAIRFGSNVADEIFSQFEMSEDERIRKAIIVYLRSILSNKKYGDKSIEYWIAWLEKQKPIWWSEEDSIICQEVIHVIDNCERFEQERNHENCVDFHHYQVLREWLKFLSNKYISQQPKQGEQKPADRVKLMFKVGDWIIYDRHISKVKDMDSEGYLVEDTYGDEGILPKEFAEKHYHLWTIAEAKDGDVLNSVRVKATIIFKGWNPDGKHLDAYCALQKGILIKQEMLWDRDFEPATKEQRDTLEKAIADAGYTFDFEKKELKKIEQKLADKPKFKIKYAGGEYNVLEVKDIAGVTYYGIEDELNHIDYVLPDNCEIVSEQKPVDVRTTGYWHVEDVEQKPTDEEMKVLLRTEYEKGRADAIAEMQKPWSEKDEVALGDALWCCKQAASIAKNENDMGNVWYAETWLKSLKERYT